MSVVWLGSLAADIYRGRHRRTVKMTMLGSVWARNWKRWDTCLTKLKKVRHMSHQVRHMSNWHHYFEASKPVCMVAMQVCMVAMHYQLPFMISKCLLQSPSLNNFSSVNVPTPPLTFQKWANNNMDVGQFCYAYKYQHITHKFTKLDPTSRVLHR